MTKKSEFRLQVSFSYDHISGLFSAHMENGSIIPVSRSDIGGKLENALTLFRRAVTALEYPDEVREAKKENPDVALIAEAIALGLVQTVGVKKAPEVNLDLLD